MAGVNHDVGLGLNSRQKDSEVGVAGLTVFEIHAAEMVGGRIDGHQIAAKQGLLAPEGNTAVGMPWRFNNCQLRIPEHQHLPISDKPAGVFAVRDEFGFGHGLQPAMLHRMQQDRSAVALMGFGIAMAVVGVGMGINDVLYFDLMILNGHKNRRAILAWINQHPGTGRAANSEVGIDLHDRVGDVSMDNHKVKAPRGQCRKGLE